VAKKWEIAPSRLLASRKSDIAFDRDFIAYFAWRIRQELNLEPSDP